MAISKMVILTINSGFKDIKNHRWFNSLNWDDLIKKKIKPFYTPKVKNIGDVSNYEDVTDSNSEVPEVRPANDPFLNW